MADNNLNDAHIPDSSDPVPPNTHDTPTPRESVAPAELAAGTSIVSPLPGTMNIQHPPVGVMANPIIESNPSGCKVTPYSPSGTHDVDSSGRPA